MCKGDFKEAHERHIVLPDDDPVDIGIMVQYLYWGDFWTSGNPQTGVSKHDSAIRLAHLYILADKYNIESMKDVVAKKILKYIDIEKPERWLALADIIYAAIPESDNRYPKILRSLVVRFMNTSQRNRGKNGLNGALLVWTAKGGRLATDISRGSRKYWATRVRNRNAAIAKLENDYGIHATDFNDSNLDDEESYDEDFIRGKAG